MENFVTCSDSSLVGWEINLIFVVDNWQKIYSEQSIDIKPIWGQYYIFFLYHREFLLYKLNGQYDLVGWILHGHCHLLADAWNSLKKTQILISQLKVKALRHKCLWGIPTKNPIHKSVSEYKNNTNGRHVYLVSFRFLASRCFAYSSPVIHAKSWMSVLFPFYG